MRVLLVYPNLMFQTMFPMGIAILSSLLKERGCRVEAFDTTFYQTDDLSPHHHQVKNLQVKPLSREFERKLAQMLRPRGQMIADFRSRVEAFQPDLIAISAVEDTFRIGLDLLEGVRDLGIPNLVGGVYSTFAPEKAIRHEAVDMICIGEGEGPIVDLCEALSGGRDFSRIPNLWVKQPNGDIVRNPMRQVVDLDSLPMPDFDLFDNGRFYFTTKAQGRLMSSASVETARGCPYTCAFCNSPSQNEIHEKGGAGHFFRLKSVDAVYRELRKLKDDFKIEYIYFPADTFLALPEGYLSRLAEMYEDINLPFWCQTRSETLTPERVRILEKMGCQNISIGLEHGNEDFRREVVSRNYSNSDFLERLQLLQGSPMNVTLNNIIGLPTENRALTDDTIELNRRVAHLVGAINGFHFVPYHGTPLRQMAIDRGYINDDTEVSHNFKDTVLNMPEYSPSAIRGAVRTFTLYVRFPQSEYPRIARAEILDDEGDRTFRELEQEFINTYFDSKNTELHGGLNPDFS